MNQILISSKVYVTKELKRKQRIYQTIFLISILFLFETSGVIDGESFKPNPRTVTSLRKPPEAEAILHFEGGSGCLFVL